MSPNDGMRMSDSACREVTELGVRGGRVVLPSSRRLRVTRPERVKVDRAPRDAVRPPNPQQ